jgi:hypothetical protein
MVARTCFQSAVEFGQQSMLRPSQDTNVKDPWSTEVLLKSAASLKFAVQFVRFILVFL